MLEEDEDAVGGDFRFVPEEEDDEEELALPLPLSFLSFEEKTIILGAILLSGVEDGNKEVIECGNVK